nr:MAG TPA: hypothetical protein [Bacteriophage sp.]
MHNQQSTYFDISTYLYYTITIIKVRYKEV